MEAGRRKWFRWSLRTALLGVTLACIWLAWLSHSWRQQEHVLAEMRAMGGNLMTVPSRLAWLEDLLPGTTSVPFQRVVAVTFLGPKVSDAEVEAVVGHLSYLPSLDSVIFMDTAITSDGENRLRKELPELEIQVITTASVEPSTPSR